MSSANSMNESSRNGKSKSKLDHPDPWMQEIMGTRRDVRAVLNAVHATPQQTAELVQSQIVEVIGKPPAAQIIFSDDFCVCHWGTKRFKFSTQQARCVQAMWEARQNGTPELTQIDTLDKAESKHVDGKKRQLFRVFRRKNETGKDVMHPAWGEMIVPGQSNGLFRLADPPV